MGGLHLLEQTWVKQALTALALLLIILSGVWLQMERERTRMIVVHRSNRPITPVDQMGAMAERLRRGAAEMRRETASVRREASEAPNIDLVDYRPIYPVVDDDLQEVGQSGGSDEVAGGGARESMMPVTEASAAQEARRALKDGTWRARSAGQTSSDEE